MEKLEFYKCETCGSVKVDILTDLEDCCNTDMIMMVPNTVDAAIEKHMPVASFDDKFHIIAADDIGTAEKNIINPDGLHWLQPEFWQWAV